MFKSKKDVDAHVRDVFSKCKSENEVNQFYGNIHTKIGKIQTIKRMIWYEWSFIDDKIIDFVL